MKQSKSLIRLTALATVILLLAVACAPTPTPSQPTSEPTPAQEAPTAPAVAEQPTVAAAEAPVASDTGGTRTFVIDPAQTEVSYEVDEEFFGGALDQLGIGSGQVRTTGATSQVSGQLALDFGGAVPQLAAGEFTIDISTLQSNDNRRDNSIRRNWLQSSQYPVATFKATAIQGAPASYSEGEMVTFQLAGDLTVRGITKPVVLEVSAKLDGNTISGEAQTQFKMSEFGVEPPSFANVFVVGDDTVIRLKFAATEQ